MSNGFLFDSINMIGRKEIVSTMSIFLNESDNGSNTV